MVKNTHFLILTEKHWINASKILFIYFYQIIWSKLSNEKKKYKNKKNCLEIINFNIFFIIGLKIDCNSNWVSGQNFPPRSMKFFYKKLELFFYKILFSELIYDESKSNGNVFFRVIWCETPCSCRWQPMTVGTAFLVIRTLMEKAPSFPSKEAILEMRGRI